MAASKGDVPGAADTAAAGVSEPAGGSVILTQQSNMGPSYCRPAAVAAAVTVPAAAGARRAMLLPPLPSALRGATVRQCAAATLATTLRLAARAPRSTVEVCG